MRRTRPNPLTPSSNPRWLKVFDGYGAEISRRQLPPGHDLAAELLREADRWAAEGWVIEGDGGRSRTGTFFMNRGRDRWLVTITPAEEPLPAHSTP